MLRTKGNMRIAGSVQRYHTWPTIQSQTVADHTFHVIRIYGEVWGHLPDGTELRYLMMHDLAEGELGDVPFDAKRSFPDIKTAMDKAERTVLPALPFLTPEEKVRCKVPDLLEMWEFGVIERRLGNQYAEAIIEDTRCAALLVAGEENEERVLRWLDR